MCGRYSLAEVTTIKERFGLGDMPELGPRYNIAPAQAVPVIINTNARKLQMFKWGLIPYWAKEAGIGNKLINARAETILEKPSFRHCFERRRCLVIADGFYEWQRQGRQKTPYRIRLTDSRPFAFAGLWDTWLSPSGERINSCTIITTTPNRLMAEIHDRMPVILARESEAIWLKNDVTDIATLHGLLTPYPEELMLKYQVSPLVNSPQNDSAKCFCPYTENSLFS